MTAICCSCLPVVSRGRVVSLEVEGRVTVTSNLGCGFPSDENVRAAALLLIERSKGLLCTVCAA